MIHPYEDLYVYLLKGALGEDEEGGLGNDFIGNWVEEGTSFLFFRAPARDAVLGLLGGRSDLEFQDEHHFTYEQWQGGGLETLRIGPFRITSPWEGGEAKDGEIKVVLDPGVVFGTGLHPTTRDCVRALVYLRGITPLKRLLDLGTGTGILALIAAFLGAEEVLAVDLNPLCVKTAKRNVELNHLEEVVKVIGGRAEKFVGEPAHVVVANLHYDALVKVMDHDKVQDKGWFIVSGLMRSQAREFNGSLGRLGLEVVRTWDHDMTWFTLLVQNLKFFQRQTGHSA